MTSTTMSDEQIVAYDMTPHPSSSSFHHLEEEDEEDRDEERDGMEKESDAGELQSYHRQLPPPSSSTHGVDDRPSGGYDERILPQPGGSFLLNGGPTVDRPPMDEKELRRQRLAEMARLRYQNLSTEEKKAVNSRRMLLRKRKRQREREMEELEQILRSTNDIEEDVVFIGELREKRQRESRARAARSRYHSMTPEERRAYNQKRRLRQLGIVDGGESGDASTATAIDSESIKQQIAQQNRRKAELARQRYHRMSIEERKIYNKRRTESLRRRRIEEEALLATPAGQIDSDALQRAQQIMYRNAARAEKARERYKRKAPEERERKRARQAIQRSIKFEQSDSSAAEGSGTNSGNSGDILSAIEREVARRTMEAQRVLEQKRMGAVHSRDGVAHLSPNFKHEAVIIQYADNKPVIAHAPPPYHQIVHAVGPAHGHPAGPPHMRPGQHMVSHVHEAAPPPPQQPPHHQMQEVMVLPSGAIVHHAGVPPPHCQSSSTIVSAAPYHGQTIVHAAAPATAGVHPTGNIIMQDVSGKPVTKYVSYMQLPANATTQNGFILADGQFVAIQEPVQGYAIEQPVSFDGSFQHINPGTAVLRTSSGPAGQPIIIGQRVELVNASPSNHHHHPPISYHQQPSSQLPNPNTIHVVNYSGGGSGHQQSIQPQPPPQHHIIAQHVPPSQQQYTVQQPAHIVSGQPPPPQMTLISSPGPPQPHQISVIPVSASTSSAATSGAETQYHIDEKMMSQRAKRAERARRRYHEMTAEARHEFNAKRAHALKMSRLRDEELCRLGDELEMSQQEISEEMMADIDQARIRKNKRAETARQKYQKMTPEQRKIHNAMRDAQRRQRRRELEESELGGGDPIEMSG